MINGKALHWRDLQPLLAEAAGGLVLEEIVLDRMLDERLTREGLTITDEDIEKERSLLHETLHDDPDTAHRLLEQLRQRRGFGSRRFRLLLQRNAALRALVEQHSGIEVTDQAVQRLYDIQYGPKRQPRLIVVPTLSEARSAIERLDDGELFGDVAVELSTDSSASRGGLLEPISRSDPSYPKALREALWKLDVGQRSEPILLDQRYAVLKLVREVPGENTALNDVRDELEQQVRWNQQRLAMDQLARQLLREASVTVFDQALHESWRDRQQIGISQPQ
jgi:foldase protein PrsA